MDNDCQIRKADTQEIRSIGSNCLGLSDSYRRVRSVEAGAGADFLAGEWQAGQQGWREASDNPKQTRTFWLELMAD
jgi:isocitrate dehydrogenase kinase/phosphatase